MKYIRKRKTRRGDTRWFIDIGYKGPDGKRHRYRKDVRANNREAAKKKLTRLLKQLDDTGTLVVADEGASRKVLTIADAADRFVQVEMTDLKTSTAIGYKRSIDSVIRPCWGHVPLEHVTKAFLAEVSAQLARRKTRTGESLSASSRRNILVALRRVLMSADTAQWLDHPLPLPKLPKVKAGPPRAPSRQDVETIRGVANHSLGLAILIASDAGLRAGEIRGLRWSDIDLDARVITVQRSICRGVAGTPKSGCGRRVYMTDELHAALVATKPSRTRKGTPVAPNTQGNVWSESGLYVAFKAACRRAGIEGLRFHDLRHHFVTEMFRHGAPATVVKNQAGHITLSTTDRYAGATAEDCRAAMRRVSEHRREEDDM